MPTAPRSRCSEPTCHQFATDHGKCEEHKRPAWANRPTIRERYGISGGKWRSLKRQVSRRDNGCCYMCGREPHEGETFELDHITPIAENGSAADLDNLGLACKDCHAEKSKAESARGNARRRARGRGRGDR
ncbi:HNH endonuclease [Streptomyces marokkonensis]|uniref:HNH endonuclease n=1 Tax=Streptomyces marokkonensis TaxID=324855 RepID=UPI0011F20AAC|nr:HNH endonuclease signature motif containing protein [Streptomyces marokkonensis]